MIVVHDFLMYCFSDLANGVGDQLLYDHHCNGQHGDDSYPEPEGVR